MKEIEFRGKSRMGKWNYGYLTNNATLNGSENEDLYIRDKKTGGESSAYPDTIGQYTGLKDESGEKIFKNDIFKLDGDEYNYLVVFKDGAFGFHGEITGDFFPFAEGALNIVDGVVQGLTIVGNTSDNLELLKQNENY